MDCIKCDRSLPSDGRFLTCCLCQNGYHLGKTCSGVADTTFGAMGTSKRENWRCYTCRTSELRSGSGAENSASVLDLGRPDMSQQEQAVDDTVASQLTSIRAALAQLLTLKTSVDSLLPLPAKVDQLLDLKPAVEELRTTVDGLQKTVDSFGTKYDSVLALAKANEGSIKDLGHEVRTVKAVVEEQTQEILRLKELNDSQQYSRRCNMEFHGLPFRSRENLITIMEDLSKKITIPSFQSSDILAIHRLPSKRDIPPIVLIQFASMTIKESWMAARGRLQRLCQSDDDPRLFFNDNLTHANKELFWMARTKGKDVGFRFVWLRNGKIFARKAEGAPAIRISAVRDLEKLV